MGIFDIFKKKKQRTEIAIEEEKSIVIETGQQANMAYDEKQNEIINDVAYASLKYKETNGNYSLYKEALLKFGYNEENIIFNTIGIVLQFYYAYEKDDALKLYKELKIDYPDNEDVIWLFIEVINIINIENDQEFVKKYLAYKKMNNDFNHHYQVEYQRGLELKSTNYYKEALEHWTSLNKIQEFSWNYYQIGILQNVLGDNNYFGNLKKAIEMDNEIKEDAKSYFELDNLRTNPAFLNLLQ